MKNRKKASNINQLVASSQEDYYEYMESVHHAFSDPRNKAGKVFFSVDAAKQEEPQSLSLSHFVTTAHHKAKPVLRNKRHAHAPMKLR